MALKTQDTCQAKINPECLSSFGPQPIDENQ